MKKIISVVMFFVFSVSARGTEIIHSSDYLNGFHKEISIYAADQSGLSDENLRELFGSTPIKTAIFDQTPLSKTNLAAITNIRSLRSLSVVGCGLRGDDITYFDGLSNLSSLYISHNQFSTDDVLKLRDLSSIETFHCWGIPIGDKGLNHILTIMPNLSEINASGCKLTDVSLATLRERMNLTKVIISENSFTNSRMESAATDGRLIF